MRRYMLAAIAFAMIGLTVTASLMAASMQSGKSAAIDPMQMMMAAKDLPLMQVDEPF